MPRALILTLQIIREADNSVRVDLVATSPPDNHSAAFESMAYTLADIAEKIISSRDLDLLGNRTPDTSLCPSLRQQTQNQDEA